MTEPKISKWQHVNVYNNKERQSLDKYKDENMCKDNIYILFPSFYQKESNYLTDLSKKNKKPKLSCILYIYQKLAN